MAAIQSRDPSKDLAEIRRSRRDPRLLDFDYLHMRHLVQDLGRAIDSVQPPPKEVLDVWCGSRAYDELLPLGAACTGLDVNDDYGVADVVSEDFLPFDDASFDLVMSIEAFHFHPEPTEGVAEISRVLRSGGTAIVTVPFAWEYNPSSSEHRFTEPELRALFGDWEGVQVIENGGIGVSWATITNAILYRVINRAGSGVTGRLAHLAVMPLFIAVNLLGGLIERASRGHGATLPMNLLVQARKPDR